MQQNPLKCGIPVVIGLPSRPLGGLTRLLGLLGLLRLVRLPDASPCLALDLPVVALPQEVGLEGGTGFRFLALPARPYEAVHLLLKLVHVLVTGSAPDRGGEAERLDRGRGRLLNHPRRCGQIVLADLRVRWELCLRAWATWGRRWGLYWRRCRRGELGERALECPQCLLDAWLSGPAATLSPQLPEKHLKEDAFIATTPLPLRAGTRRCGAQHLSTRELSSGFMAARDRCRDLLVALRDPVPLVLNGLLRRSEGGLCLLKRCHVGIP